MYKYSSFFENIELLIITAAFHVVYLKNGLDNKEKVTITTFSSYDRILKKRDSLTDLSQQVSSFSASEDAMFFSFLLA
ncbi:hypothetical protein A359_02490 [secondary endosymbiont of Ctenarytaina eucalypti]|uniref:Uncharacterized protein n=1 Tax=secondary endosymbiont of Ctenarytaina eucalypti TaxID=1199245 RepID=J3TX37_9ENTR|nr:hypothetical protein A359_02490 [secondary endosymbiont of Ctenarytaina eucalypti]